MGSRENRKYFQEVGRGRLIEGAFIRGGRLIKAGRLFEEIRYIELKCL